VILVTVGTQLGFDRLIKAMDELAPALKTPVIAQTGPGEYQPRNMQAQSGFASEEFEQIIKNARFIVSHAGIGTVLTAQRLAKPIILFPRRFELGEHRNDHQLATVRKLEAHPGILVAFTKEELPARIHQALDLDHFTPSPRPTVQRLNNAIESFIQTGRI